MRQLGRASDGHAVVGASRHDAHAVWRAQLPPSGRARAAIVLLVGMAAALVLVLTVPHSSPEDAARRDRPTLREASSSAAPDGRIEAPDVDLYPGRPDRRASDRETAFGDSVEIAGLQTTVDQAALQPTQDIHPHLVAIVSLVNTTDRPRTYDVSHWSARYSNGRSFHPVTNPREDALRSGTLPPGGTVEGSVFFDAYGSGEYYLAFRPDPTSTARGVWRVDVR